MKPRYTNMSAYAPIVQGVGHLDRGCTVVPVIAAEVLLAADASSAKLFDTLGTSSCTAGAGHARCVCCKRGFIAALAT